MIENVFSRSGFYIDKNVKTKTSYYFYTWQSEVKFNYQLQEMQPDNISFLWE